MSRSRAARITGFALVGVLAGGLTTTVDGAATAPAEPMTWLRDARIDESSGLASSYRHPGAVYTHNDNGDSARFFAVGLRSGSTQAVLSLAGAPAVSDLEDISVGPDRTIWLADIGTNTQAREVVAVYAVAEPTVLSSSPVPWTRYRLAYAGQPMAPNAETVLVRPSDGRLFVVTKAPAASSGAVWQAPAELSTSRVNVLRRVRVAPPLVTAGSFTRTGDRFALRSNATREIYVYAGMADSTPTRIASPAMRQPESLTWRPDGDAVYVGSEGARSPIYRIPVD